jgi:hypothetical protein
VRFSKIKYYQNVYVYEESTIPCVRSIQCTPSGALGLLICVRTVIYHWSIIASLNQKLI